MNEGAENLIVAGTKPRLDVGGSQLEFLAPPGVIGIPATSILRGTLPPGGVVPLHSHHDSESFYVLSGEMEIYLETEKGSGWRTVRSGDLAVIRGGQKHAWRNAGSEPNESIVFTGNDVCHFLQELAKPASPGEPPTRPDPAVMLEVSKKYGHWLATPEENAAIGITGL